MSTHQVPEVGSIDLDFIPESYFTERDLQLALPSDILGQARRNIARLMVAEGEDPPPELLEAVLAEDDRMALGRIHPMFMGGEYLPELQEGEVEIARISLESVTADQISVRALRTLGRISYSIVDEYEQGFMNYVANPATSIVPLTLRELVAMLDGACEGGGAVMCHTASQIDLGAIRDEVRYFTSVESDFYPDLGSYYEARFDEYFESLAREDEDEEGEE